MVILKDESNRAAELLSHCHGSKNGYLTSNTTRRLKSRRTPLDSNCIEPFAFELRVPLFISGVSMQRPSIYVKMKVLGAIDIAEGKTRHERIHNVAAMTFTDEEGKPHQFTWRTIQTWHYRYKNHGDGKSVASGQGNHAKSDSRRSPRSDQLGAATLSRKDAEQNSHLSILHRKGASQSKPNRSKHVLSDGQPVRITQSRSR